MVLRSFSEVPSNIFTVPSLELATNKRPLFATKRTPCGSLSPEIVFARLPALRSMTSRQVNRSEEHTPELQSRSDLVCRLLLEKKKQLELTHVSTQLADFD